MPFSRSRARKSRAQGQTHTHKDPRSTKDHGCRNPVCPCRPAKKRPSGRFRRSRLRSNAAQAHARTSKIPVLCGPTTPGDPPRRSTTATNLFTISKNSKQQRNFLVCGVNFSLRLMINQAANPTFF